MSKTFFVDTTLCMGCRGCQVACKQWHDLPAEATENRGTYENPPDLSFSTYKLVRMSEVVVDGKLNWLFFPEQCRHCIEAPCLETAEDAEAIYQDEATGAIIYTANTKRLDAEEIISSCPYNVPRKAADGTLAKCDMCLDRVLNGLAPACVKTCPTGAMQFGDRADMTEAAEKRLEIVSKSNPKSQLLDADDVNVIYLVTAAPDLYYPDAVAAHSSQGMTRHVALQRMFSPLTRAVSQFG